MISRFYKLCLTSPSQEVKNSELRRRSRHWRIPKMLRRQEQLRRQQASQSTSKNRLKWMLSRKWNCCCASAMRNYSRRSKMLRSRWEANASKRKKTKTSSAKLRTRSVINVVSVPMKKTTLMIYSTSIKPNWVRDLTITIVRRWSQPVRKVKSRRRRKRPPNSKKLSWAIECQMEDDFLLT